jgi:hypothetical protein
MGVRPTLTSVLLLVGTAGWSSTLGCGWRSNWAQVLRDDQMRAVLHMLAIVSSCAC